ncbi:MULTISPECIES: DNA primase [Sphingomonadaceae]|uniref:DNA primase n=1 Tax=Sphingomonadales TaxID=204457 RepID=UPI00076FE0BC|nr:DNA primase [Sphingobium sp. TKS]AMK23187.1 DNA primase [Sphingobium sp. TKS]MCF8707578.1 DNA primase [Rhizorhapis sp. SPR117]
MRFPPAFLDEVRARTKISDVIGRSVKLIRAGKEFKACCPFHSERDPSFTVSDEKGFFHCFSCGAHGDAIQFLIEANGLGFVDAVRELAAAAKLELPAADPRAAERSAYRQRLFDVLAEASRWFVAQLAGPQGHAARAYLDARGITPDTREAFTLGYAPATGQALLEAFQHRKPGLLVDAGLVIALANRAPYDRFRDRLIFPIRDIRGRVIAFGGRVLDDERPKYMNSPETALFDKGSTLFNVDRAVVGTRRSGRLLVVEGYMDVIALAQAGIEETVAPLGTALSEAHIERLWTIADVPLLCFDGDAAGQGAAVRAALRALPGLVPGRSLAFAPLPEGQDPDEIVRSGGRAAVELLIKAQAPLADLLWHHEFNNAQTATPEGRAGLQQRLSDHVASIRNATVADQYRIEFTARFNRQFPPLGPPTESQATHSVGASHSGDILNRCILAGLVRYPELVPDHLAAIKALPLGDDSLRRIRDILTEKGQAGHDLAGGITRAGLGDAVVALMHAASLPFSFLRKPPSERGRADLAAAINALEREFSRFS